MTHISPPNRTAVKIFNFCKFKMADGGHLKNSKNGCISATDCLVGTKFGTNTHIDPRTVQAVKILKVFPEMLVVIIGKRFQDSNPQYTKIPTKLSQLSFAPICLIVFIGLITASEMICPLYELYMYAYTSRWVRGSMSVNVGFGRYSNK